MPSSSPLVMGNDRNDRHLGRQENHDPDLVSAVNTPSLNKFLPASNLKPGTHLKTPDGQGAVVVSGSTPAVHDGWMWDLTVPGNNDHDFYVIAEGASDQRAHEVRVGDVAVLVHNTDGCELFSNTMPGTLRQEMATAERLGVKPAAAGSAGFDSALNTGTIKWAVLEDGTLVVMPKFADGVEISHSVLSGGAAVRAAGEADVAGSADTGYFGLDINNHSGHFLPSQGSLQIGIDAFSAAGIEFP